MPIDSEGHELRPGMLVRFDRSPRGTRRRIFQVLRVEGEAVVLDWFGWIPAGWVTKREWWREW